MSNKTNARIYLVTRNGSDHRLIRAANKSQAIGYCARNDYQAEVASQETLVGLRHLEVESAVEPGPSVPPSEGIDPNDRTGD